MPAQSLRSTLDSLAHEFASAVLEVIRTASIDELVGESKRAPAPRLPAAARARTPIAPPVAAAVEAVAGGRLTRRSAEDVERTLGLVLAAVKANGMRAEELQKFLSLDKRELPRVLALGLSKKVLKKKGQKRATIYSAA